jgi:hypothetical protein
MKGRNQERKRKVRDFPMNNLSILIGNVYDIKENFMTSNVWLLMHFIAIQNLK